MLTASNMQLIAGITYDIRATFGGETMYLYVNGTLIGTNTYYLGVQSGSENYVGMGGLIPWSHVVPQGIITIFNILQHCRPTASQTLLFIHPYKAILLIVQIIIRVIPIVLPLILPILLQVHIR